MAHTFSGIALMTAVTLGILTTTGVARADDAACTWKPERAVTMIVPWGTGGGTDANARRLASLLEQEMGVPFNVVNRTGGNGVIGHTALARARPDGYTIGAATIELATMHHLGLTPLTWQDATPIALVDQNPASVVVKEDARWDSLESLLEEARENPGELTASGTAQGGIWHLALAGMLQAEGLPPDAIRWVPSQGASPALQELMAGGVDVATPSLSEAQHLVQQGELKALAYMSDTPNSSLPEVPLTADVLDSGWTQSAFMTISGPGNLPEEMTCAYDQAIRKITRSDEWAQFKASRGSEVVYEGPEQTAELFHDTDQQLGDVINAIGLAR
ncbi:Tripartite-type tricarboxylate transporter, receptor component TctC [Kushneria avicenniae]|uniref:Tripartite-type tricarboxylate transporter, receptor component TctC n=1 Tax=Kushneria avicenniae TaxID=402385 RepID=A0A1I1JK94_9GAMM|nr:tripartite tricarboxylate transporter substrate binding protein [Kushneria avicenniae]SFC49029.1 Tripartite-type tricarboxylate transporter, receptor component TctC [Kushneria avicenniae]